MIGALVFSAATLGIFACAAIRMNNRNDTSIGPIATSIALMAAGWGVMG